MGPDYNSTGTLVVFSREVEYPDACCVRATPIIYEEVMILTIWLSLNIYCTIVGFERQWWVL